MNSLKFFVIFSTFLSVSIAQYWFLGSNQCPPTSTCVVAQNCPMFYFVRGNLPTCGFYYQFHLVCCPTFAPPPPPLKIQERISSQKCKEYAQKSFKVTPRFSRSKRFINAGVTFGKSTSNNEFPHMAAIGWRTKGGEIEFRCGGSLISENFVLSAAHCTRKPNVIRIGDNNLKDPNDGANPQEFAIININVHPQYKHGSKYNDIALFELSRSARFDESVLPACLPQSNEDLTNSAATAIGWGKTENEKTSDTLLKVELDVISTSECNKNYDNFRKQYGIREGISSGQICALDRKGGQDTCYGDSGGPLQLSKFVETSEMFEVIGVTSFGISCGGGVPGVYTKVYSYLDWIESIVWLQKNQNNFY